MGIKGTKGHRIRRPVDMYKYMVLSSVSLKLPVGVHLDIKAWFNGNIVNWDQVKVSPLSHGFSRGSSIFEVIGIVPTPRGTAYVCLEDHIKRFFRSSELTGIKLSVTEEDLYSALIELARVNNVHKGIAKLFAYYSGVEFETVPHNPVVDVAMFCFDLEHLGIRDQDLARSSSPGISSFRKVPNECIPSQVKVSGLYVIAYMSMMNALAKGLNDVIMLDIKGNIAEGPTSNVFFVKQQSVETPTLRNILPGITRKMVIEIAGDLGLDVIERDIRPEEIPGYNEAFFTDTLDFVRPISEIDGRKLGNSCPGPVTRLIIQKINDIMHGTMNNKYIKWFSFV